MSDAATGAKRQAGVPRLRPRKAYLSRDYYILVVWPDGGRQKIGRFANREEAAIWVKRCAKTWLSGPRDALVPSQKHSDAVPLNASF